MTPPSVRQAICYCAAKLLQRGCVSMSIKINRIKTFAYLCHAPEGQS
ncbi:hypothetical protein [Marivita sp. S2033]